MPTYIIQWNTGRWAVVMLWLVAAIGCTSVPPQVAQLHLKEGEILHNLETAHLAMIDSFVDQKLIVFEDFFFKKYGPAFRENWITIFETEQDRDYVPETDFGLFYNDLVAEYVEESAPIEEIRKSLRSAIKTEYRNAHSAHESVGNWLNSVQALNAMQKQFLKGLLGSIKPGLNLDSIDKAVADAKERIKAKIEKLEEAE